jgi:hypothetical protein
MCPRAAAAADGRYGDRGPFRLTAITAAVRAGLCSGAPSALCKRGFGTSGFRGCGVLPTSIGKDLRHMRAVAQSRWHAPRALCQAVDAVVPMIFGTTCLRRLGTPIRGARGRTSDTDTRSTAVPRVTEVSRWTILNTARRRSTRTCAYIDWHRFLAQGSAVRGTLRAGRPGLWLRTHDMRARPVPTSIDTDIGKPFRRDRTP